MQDIISERLDKLEYERKRFMRVTSILMVFSVVVSIWVFWVLRRPGITLVGDADCGIEEHTHSDECFSRVLLCEQTEENHVHDDSCFGEQTDCTKKEHVHVIGCYSDENADTETALDWQTMLEGYASGNLPSDLVAVARSQIGYTESERNFVVDSEGIRRGYTRYGAWYGVPYNDWSAVFVSFCLHYAGSSNEETPYNTGADSMMLSWKIAQRFAEAGEYSPDFGDLVFFDDNTVGIVSEVYGRTVCVIKGDADNSVAVIELLDSDSSIKGWGMIRGAHEPSETLDTEPSPELTEPTITKEVSFHPNDGKFHWSITANIPGEPEGRAGWSIKDISNLADTEYLTSPPTFGAVDRFTNVTVSAADGDTWIIVPLDQAENDTEFVYMAVPSEDGFTLRFGMRCICEEGRCPGTLADSDYCIRWRLPESAVVQINYARDGHDLISDYGGSDVRYFNRADLIKREDHSDGPTECLEASAEGEIPIPDVFRTELGSQPNEENNSTASLSVLINQSHLRLAEGENLTVVGTLTDGLTYVPGSLSIRGIPAEGDAYRLRAVEDYNFFYDSEKHLLAVSIQKTGSEAFIMDFDVGVVPTDEAAFADQSVSVSAELFGTAFLCTEKLQIQSSAVPSESVHSVQISLTEGHSGNSQPLSGAEIGLFAENGELLVSGNTDENGSLTLISSSIRPHTLYYVKQISPVEGYRPDSAQHWLCFCSTAEESCEICTELLADTASAYRAADGADGGVPIVNRYLGKYRLPATGGSGYFPYAVLGTVLIVAPLALSTIRRLKRKKKGVP